MATIYHGNYCHEATITCNNFTWLAFLSPSKVLVLEENGPFPIEQLLLRYWHLHCVPSRIAMRLSNRATVTASNRNIRKAQKRLVMEVSV